MAKFLPCCLLVVFAAAAQDDTPKFGVDVTVINLNGGLTAQLFSLTRDAVGGRPVVTAAVKITNASKDNHAFLFFYGSLSAVDEAGIKFEPPGDAVTGVSYCNTVPGERCIGKPDASLAFPLQS